MGECWVAIAGFEGFYEISNLGHIRSCARTICAPGGKPRTLPQRRMTGSIKTNGYIHVSLRKPGQKQKKKLLHQLVATAFIRPGGVGFEVNHKDGNKLNNNVTNLEWCTRAQNMAHAWDNGLMPSQRRAA